VPLLRLQMRQRMRVGSHTRLHAHHGPCLADGAIGTGYVLHTRRH
jgi:hypothetical protein